MARWTRVALLVGVCVALVPMPSSAHDDESGVVVQGSAFRWCDGDEVACEFGGPSHDITVSPGTTVRFVYNDAACEAILLCPGHDVVFEDGLNSGPVYRRATWGVDPGEPDVSANLDTGSGTLMERTFDVPGTYPFWCTPHKDSGMVGTITVSDT